MLLIWQNMERKWHKVFYDILYRPVWISTRQAGANTGPLPICKPMEPDLPDLLDLTPAHADMLAVPDASSVIQLPWKKDVAWVAADCVMEDEKVLQAPRNVLRSLINQAEAKAIILNLALKLSSFF